MTAGHTLSWVGWKFDLSGLTVFCGDCGKIINGLRGSRETSADNVLLVIEGTISGAGFFCSWSRCNSFSKGLDVCFLCDDVNLENVLCVAVCMCRRKLWLLHCSAIVDLHGLSEFRFGKFYAPWFSKINDCSLIERRRRWPAAPKWVIKWPVMRRRNRPANSKENNRHSVGWSVCLRSRANQGESLVNCV